MTEAAAAATAQLPWGVVTLLVGLIVAWSLVIIATVRWVVGKALRGYDIRFLEMERDLKKNVENLSKLQAALPLEYVRKEDQIRRDVVLDAKLDAIYGAIEKSRSEG